MFQSMGKNKLKSVSDLVDINKIYIYIYILSFNFKSDF